MECETKQGALRRRTLGFFSAKEKKLRGIFKTEEDSSSRIIISRDRKIAILMFYFSAKPDLQQPAAVLIVS